MTLILTSTSLTSINLFSFTTFDKIPYKNGMQMYINIKNIKNLGLSNFPSDVKDSQEGNAIQIWSRNNIYVQS